MSGTGGEQSLAFAGVLSDKRINELLDRRALLEHGTWDKRCVRECSYLARLGRVYKLARPTTINGVPSREFVERLLHPNENLELPAGATALLYFSERLRLPDNVMALTIPRGVLYAESLCPAVSYVDPGYSGSFYLPVTNLSTRTILLPLSLEIARVFFFALSEDVDSPFSDAKSADLPQELRSLPTFPSRSLQELQEAQAEELLEEMRQGQDTGRESAELIGRALAVHDELEMALSELRSEAFAQTAYQKRRMLTFFLAAVGVGLGWPVLFAGLVSEQWRDRIGALGGLGLVVVGAMLSPLIAAMLERKRAK